MRKGTNQRPNRRPANRRGSAAVEFALVAPIFIALIVGGVQYANDFDSTHKMYAAIRQSGRLASMDSSELLQPGQTANDKVIQDIKNSLTAEGLPGSDVTVSITHADGENAGAVFDLSDADTDLKYFRIETTIPYASANSTGFMAGCLTQLKASVVFRKGRNSLVN